VTYVVNYTKFAAITSLLSAVPIPSTQHVIVIKFDRFQLPLNIYIYIKLYLFIVYKLYR